MFEDDYDLMPLDELSKFIEANGHLPNVPSAADVKAKGQVNMSKLQMTLLEKIEELTLFKNLRGRLNSVSPVIFTKRKKMNIKEEIKKQVAKHTRDPLLLFLGTELTFIIMVEWFKLENIDLENISYYLEQVEKDNEGIGFNGKLKK